MLKQTPLNAAHRAAHARMVDFGGWDMPLHYGSQLDEHHAVRVDAGMFDVSHMRVLDLQGDGSRNFLRRALANDVDKLTTPGRALYTCLLNADGGVIDDLIVYWMGASAFRLVVNAGTADKDVEWLRGLMASEASPPVLRVRDDLAIIAVQGPRAREKALQAMPELREASEGLKPFSAASVGDCFVARTGYTGEDGFEIMLPAARAPALWEALRAAGVRPCGLGARDTLRLEAGMNLYGQDMDEGTSPLESGLAWTVDLKSDREFVGRSALEAGPARRRQQGLVLEDARGVLRAHQRVRTDAGEGEITSGTYSPTLARSIALARLPAGVAPGMRVEVMVRDRPLAARVVKPPFVRNGKVLVDVTEREQGQGGKG